MPTSNGTPATSNVRRALPQLTDPGKVPVLERDTAVCSQQGRAHSSPQNKRYAPWIFCGSVYQRIVSVLKQLKNAASAVLLRGLTAFEHLAFDDAVAKASAECGKKVNTKGWYT